MNKTSNPIPLNLDFREVFIRDNSSKILCKTFTNKSEFISTLKKHPLLNVGVIVIVYEIPEKGIIHIEARPQRMDEWQLFSLNNLLFTFNCGHAELFFENIEDNLMNFLNKVN